METEDKTIKRNYLEIYELAEYLRMKEGTIKQYLKRSRPHPLKLYVTKIGSRSIMTLTNLDKFLNHRGTV